MAFQNLLRSAIGLERLTKKNWKVWPPLSLFLPIIFIFCRVLCWLFPYSFTPELFGKLINVSKCLAITAAKHTSFSSTPSWLNQERNKKKAGQTNLVCSLSWPGCCRKEMGARRESEDFLNGTNLNSLWPLSCQESEKC